MERWGFNILIHLQLCVFSNLENQYRWTHSGSYRCHTHDILCTAITLLKDNYSVLYSTTVPKELKKQRNTLRGNRINPYTNAVIKPLSNRKRGREDEEVNSEEDELEESVPVCSGLTENSLSLVLIVSGSVDGNLVLYNQHSKQENLTYKYTNYPNYFNPVISQDHHYCLMQVLSSLLSLLQYDHYVDLVKLGETNHVPHSNIHLNNKHTNVTLLRLGLESGYQVVTRIHLHGGSNIHGSSILEQNGFVYIVLHDIHQVKLFQYSVEENSV